MQKRLKLLLIAPCADETDVGEAWSSFQWASHLSRLHDLTLLTYRKRSRPSVIPQLPHARVVEWLEWPLVGRFERFNSGVQPTYAGFYFRARKWLRNRLRAGEHFDLIHQQAPLGLRFPSPAIGFGLPLVFGPVAGSLETPPEWANEMGSMPWYTQLRKVDALRFRFDPFLRRTYQEADLILGAAPYVKDILHDISLKRFECMSETGVLALPQLSDEQGNTPTCRLLFVGRVVRTKGVRDAVRAIAHLPSSCDVQFDVVGEGEDRVHCEQEARSLGVDKRIVFHGRVPRAQVDAFYRAADVFVFPSFREPSGNVVLEAMSFGLPMIVAARGGPGYVVGESCGVRVPVTNPADFAQQIAAAIERMVYDADFRRQCGDASRKCIQEQHLWPRKAESLSQLYSEVLSRRTNG